MDEHKFPPVYKHSFKEAVIRGEVDQFRASHALNVECAKAIDAVLAKYYDVNTYELYTEPASRDVVTKFGFDRTMSILANTVQHYSWDGRFSRTSMEWARTIPRLNGQNIDKSCLVSGNAGLADLLVGRVCYDYELTQPLKEAEIRAEAKHILKLFQAIPEPNSPNKTEFMAKISPEFNARAKPDDLVTMLKMLPFSNPLLTTLPGQKGFFVVTPSKEMNNQHQQLRKPSIKAQLAAKPVPGDKPATKQKDREVR